MKESEFQCILSAYFDNDYDVNEITKKLGINPQISLRYSESGYTKITNIKQPGSWQYYVPHEYRSGWSVQEALEEFFKPFSREKVKELSKIVQCNDGKVILNINIYFQHEKLPEMCFDGDVMQIIHDLNASIHINMNEDVE